LLAAFAVLATALALVLASGPSSQAQSDRLERVRAQQEQLRAELQEQNVAIDRLIGQVGKLRVKERQVAKELAEQEAELDAARAELADAREELARVKRRLRESREELGALLVSIYRYGEIDKTSVLLNSDGIDDLMTTSTYLDRVRDYETGVVDRVRGLRAEAETQVERVESSIERMERAREAILERQEELAASRAELEAREAELQSAKDARRKRLRRLLGEERDLVQALSAPAPSGSSPAPPAENVPPPNGSTAKLNSDGTATPPANAPQAVKDAIAAANAISDKPYMWGGGHGSFESAGYDCSGAVSYALHGGGFLSSPLDSTGFMTWGDPGPGKWITVYSNPGHAYIVIAGLRFDTSGGAGPRWQGPRDPAGFVATHPPGY